jgi:hypothetical protein
LKVIGKLPCHDIKLISRSSVNTSLAMSEVYLLAFSLLTDIVAILHTEQGY